MTPGPETLAARARALTEDIELASVREWVGAAPGRRAIGYLPIYAPREIVHAAGMLPVGITGGGDRVEIIRGDAFYQSYICHLPRSTIELGLSGRLDVLDGMLFPSTCDVIRNLSGMWRMTFPDKYVRYVDVPQEFSREIGGAFWRRELQSLWHDLCDRAGTAPDEAALARSLALYNENRSLIERLYALRREAPWSAPTSEFYVVVRAGYVLPVEEHNALLSAYLRAAEESDRAPMDRARVVLAGAFCEQPPLELIKALELAGCDIVDDDFFQGARWLRGAVEPDGDPLGALADAFLSRSRPCASLYLDQGDKGADLLERVALSGAEGVLFAAPSFCDPALLDQPLLAGALDRAGVAWTAFKYAENTGQFQTIREQAGTFADSIQLWGHEPAEAAAGSAR